jgi:hypothetical protein
MLFVLLMQSAFGQLGETKDECWERFGRPLSSVTSRDRKTVSNTYSFNGGTVSCDFNGNVKSAICVSVNYNDVTFNDAETIASLLRLNSPAGSRWSECSYSVRLLPRTGSRIGFSEWDGPGGQYACMVGGSGLCICDSVEGRKSREYYRRTLEPAPVE